MLQLYISIELTIYSEQPADPTNNYWEKLISHAEAAMTDEQGAES